MDVFATSGGDVYVVGAQSVILRGTRLGEASENEERGGCGSRPSFYLYSRHPALADRFAAGRFDRFGFFPI